VHPLDPQSQPEKWEMPASFGFQERQGKAGKDLSVAAIYHLGTLAG